MESVANYVNDYKKQKENAEKLQEIQTQLSGYKVIIRAIIIIGIIYLIIYLLGICRERLSVLDVYFIGRDILLNSMRTRHRKNASAICSSRDLIIIINLIGINYY